MICLAAVIIPYSDIIGRNETEQEGRDTWCLSSNECRMILSKKPRQQSLLEQLQTGKLQRKGSRRKRNKMYSFTQVRS